MQEKLKHLPLAPGVYLMKTRSGVIVYVGKAKNLRNRVSSYFSSPLTSYPLKTQKLLETVADFEVLIVQTEVEALLLERTLIKHHQPFYNILLRDDKEYPYLKIDIQSLWPRLTKVRKRVDDDALYIGPFGHARELQTLLELTRTIFPLVRCSHYEFEHAKKPCHYFHMKKCLAPCTLPVDPQFYKNQINDVIQFLKGKNHIVLQSLQKKMQTASVEEKFEEAALLRDQVTALKNLTVKQSVIQSDVKDADVLGYHQDQDFCVILIIMLRDHRMISQDHWILEKKLDHSIEDILSEFLIQYYELTQAPPKIFVPFVLPNAKDMRTVIGTKSLCMPRGEAICNLGVVAQRNASFVFSEFQRQNFQNQSTLDSVQALLELQKRPLRIECMDISNFGNQATVASNVCFLNGKPSKENYRVMHIRTIEEKPDDFASLFEAVSRRLLRSRDKDQPMFDLLIIDGGLGQLQSALKAKEFVLGDAPCGDIVSLAKSHVLNPGLSQEVIHSEERIFKSPYKPPIVLVSGSPESRILTWIRDEAHRFALKHHRIKRSKNFFKKKL
jgi:excinuclease ABC subunit C